MNNKEAIKVIRAVPKVLKAFAKVFGGTTDPKVKAACDLAIKALKDRPCDTPSTSTSSPASVKRTSTRS